MSNIELKLRLQAQMPECLLSNVDALIARANEDEAFRAQLISIIQH